MLTVNCSPGSTDAGIVLLADAAAVAVGNIKTVAMNRTKSIGTILFGFIYLPPIINDRRK